MKVNDYDIKIDTPQFLDKESVQRLADKLLDELNPEEIFTTIKNDKHYGNYQGDTEKLYEVTE